MKVKLIAILTILMTTAMWPAVKAAPITYKGISLTPAIEQLVVAPGQDSVSYKIRIDNNQNFDQTLQLSTLDFKSLSDSGGLAFITSSPEQLQYKYGLANWIALPESTLTLPAKGGQFVTITINNRSDLTPGGHYAAVLFKVVSPVGLSGNKVEVDQVISSLIFLRKTGGEIYSLNLTKNTVHRHWAWFGWPTQVDSYFYNSGNVQTAPRGFIKLNKSSNILNPNSNLVLPESARLISSDLSAAKAPLWPGIYHVDLKYRPDGSSTFKTYSARFIYISWESLIAFLAFLYLLYRLVRRRFRLPVRRLARYLFKIRWLGAWLYKTAKYLLGLIGKLVRQLLRGLWWMLIQVDTWGGRAWNAWDRRRAKKR